MAPKANKKSRVLSFIEKYLIAPLRDDIVKSEDVQKKQDYCDCIIRNSKGEVMLLQRSYQDDFMPGKWSLPGGKLEAGEEPLAGAKRELLEETTLVTSLTFVKTIEKDNCVIHYFEGMYPEDIMSPVLDNEEHYRWEYSSFENLDRYDLIFDLGEILAGIEPELPVIERLEDEYSNVLEAIADSGSTSLNPSFEEISKAHDEDLIDSDDFLAYVRITESMEIIQKGFDEGLVTDEDFLTAIQKSKHYTFVKVVRDGKQFFQYREVGSDKVEETEIIEEDENGIIDITGTVEELIPKDKVIKSEIDNSLFANSELDVSFELIKSAFDQGQIEEDQYMQYLEKYKLIEKADPSHSGKLEKVMMIDKAGKQEVKWVSKDPAQPGDQKPGDKTKHTYAKLREFAKDTPEKELKRIINESHDEKLRKAAHKELDRRKEKEAIKKKDKKVAKKK